jgi:hypothetical protein
MERIAQKAGGQAAESGRLHAHWAQPTSVPTRTASADSARQQSLCEISPELAARGFAAEKTGRPFEAAQMSRILAEEGGQ